MIFLVLVTGYAVLDGFDLGVGMLHLLSKDDNERRLMLNTIGPVWDGNEVWLVTAGGALFAGFPDVYATLCSAFYIPLMLFLGGIIFRAVSIEFRSKQPMAWWRWTWDVMFSISSFIIALGLGVILGNLVEGIKINSEMEYVGTFFDLMHPYAFLVGAMVVMLFCMHGAIFVLMKTEDALHDKIRDWINPLIIAFIMVYGTVTMITLIYYPHMAENIKARPYFFVVAFFNMLAIANIPREIFYERDGRAFLSSCANIIFLMVLYAIGSYPYIVRAKDNPEQLSMLIENTASSPLTLKILLIMTMIGIPLVVSYTIGIYYIFRGKVKLDSTSY